MSLSCNDMPAQFMWEIESMPCAQCETAVADSICLFLRSYMLNDLKISLVNQRLESVAHANKYGDCFCSPL